MKDKKISNNWVHWTLYDTRIINSPMDTRRLDFFTIPVGQSQDGRIKGQHDTCLMLPGYLENEFLIFAFAVEIISDVANKKYLKMGRFIFALGHKDILDIPLDNFRNKRINGKPMLFYKIVGQFKLLIREMIKFSAVLSYPNKIILPVNEECEVHTYLIGLINQGG